MKFTVIIESDKEGGYVAHCPAIKGCWSQGESVNESLENIQEAIIECLKTLNARATKRI